jgi:hypothetical protein
MSKSFNVGAAVLSILLGIVTIFIAGPKKVIKKKERTTQAPRKTAEKENLFI